MRILGQDKQHQALLSTYPFTQAGMTGDFARLFDNAWLPQLVFYVRRDTKLPIHIGHISVIGTGIRFVFTDADSRQIAYADLIRTGQACNTVPIKNYAGMPYGLITYKSDILLQLIPTLTIMYGGAHETAQTQLILDTAVLQPYAHIGVQHIQCQQGRIDTIQLIDNICYKNKTISMYCDLPDISGMTITGTSQLPDVYANKHILLFCNVHSDLRVVNNQSHILVAGAVDI